MPRKIAQIYKRDGTLVPFDQEKITRAIYKAAAEVGGHDLEMAQKLSDKVVDILTNHFPKDIPAVEEIQDVVESVLIKEGHVHTARSFILYRQKRKEFREKRERERIEPIPYKVVWQTLVWNLDHSCETIDKLNAHIKNGTFRKLVEESEERYTEEINNIAFMVEGARKEGARMVIIAGPSSSGKTTTTNLLAKKLKKSDIELVKLNVDNYFYSSDHHLRDKQGDVDWEGPEALELPLINEHLKKLIEGKKVKVPRYNFKTAQREKETDELKIKPDQMILIDSHYGLYDKLTEGIPGAIKFGFYLETLAQLRRDNGEFVEWTDIRMLRRMIRDYHYRSSNPLQTVGHWHYVRRGELKNIIPYIKNADFVLDTALAYELPILKRHLFKLFPEIIKFYKKNPERQDAYFRAERVYKLLLQIKDWKDDSVVPKDSILREFIG